MNLPIHNDTLVESLCRLRDRLSVSFIPDSVLAQALHINPWFTHYYIARSLQAIRSWLHAETLQRYLPTSPANESPKSVGIITAGNVPLVGFHDVMTALLCGHIALIRTSHLDDVLMKWVLQQWSELLPALADRMFFVEEIGSVDFLLATGSNNTARHLNAQHADTTRLIRHNRFSLAILDGSESDEQLLQLNDDIFLYNGLGCRNVSNVLVTPSFDMDRWIAILNRYPASRLNTLYQEKLTWERARLNLLNEPFISTHHVLIKYSNALDFARMGIIYLIKVKSRIEANKIVREQAHHIQCVVNQAAEMGQTQTPALNDFADNVDTLKLFSELNQA